MSDQPKTNRSGSGISRWIVGLLVLGGTLILVVMHGRFSGKIEKHLKALEAAGVPLTLEEVTKDYLSLPAGENGAAAYTRAFSMLTNISLLGKERVLPTGRNFDAKALLDRNRPLYERVDRDNAAFYSALNAVTASHERAAYKIEFRDGRSLDKLTHLHRYREAYRSLELHFGVAADQGDREAMLRCSEMTLRMTDSLEREPLLLSAMVRMGGLAVALTMTEAILHGGGASNEELLRLQSMWQARGFREQFMAALSYERWFARRVFEVGGPEMLASGKQPSFGERLAFGVFRISGGKKYDELFFLEQLRELELVWSQADPFARFEGIRNLSSGFLNERARVSTELNEGNTFAISHAKIFSGMFLMPLYGAGERLLRGETMTQVVQLGLAAARYEESHGTFPGQLLEVVHGENRISTVDAFTGKQLRYVVHEAEAIIYSVGRNGKDEAGVRSRESTEDDIAFVVPRK